MKKGENEKQKKLQGNTTKIIVKTKTENISPRNDKNSTKNRRKKQQKF